MQDIKSSIALTAVPENMSRHDLLHWVNSTLSAQYKKIEELCSGVAYCQLMEIIFPNCIGIKKIKGSAKMEHEFLHNLKLFQSAFIKLNFNKSVPIDRLIKGRFQDNFEFLQWFKKFYDLHACDKENVIAPPKPICKTKSTMNIKIADKKTIPISKDPAKRFLNVNSNAGLSGNCRPVSPSSLEVLTNTSAKLKEQICSIENERNYYFNKLREIEILCSESEKKDENVEWSKKVLKILYATESG